MTEEQELRVEIACSLARENIYVHVGIRGVDVRRFRGEKYLGDDDYDPSTLVRALEDMGAMVMVLMIGQGPIAMPSSCPHLQFVLVRTRHGETAEIDLARLVPEEWPRGPEAGCIVEMPSLLRLSHARWEEFRPILINEVTLASR